MELTAYEKLGGIIRYNCAFQSLKTRDDGAVIGVTLTSGEEIDANAVILACGGFESNPDLRANLLGAEWRGAKVRGTPHNTGDGLLAAWALGAQRYGRFSGCHATPMDAVKKRLSNSRLSCAWGL